MWNNNVIFLRKGILSPETMNKISSVKHNDHAFVIFAVFFNVHGTSPPLIPICLDHIIKRKNQQFLSQHAALIPAQQMETALKLPDCTLPLPWE
jgi:hypothetical protein